MVQLERFPEFDNHEMVVRIQDADTGLKGFIAIHSTHLGPAVGGTRYWHYENEEDALRDALRLSKAMSYKCALANVPYGGGKVVLMAPKKEIEREKLKNKSYLVSYANRLAMLNDHFFTGEDVGMSKKDITILAKQTKNIIGRPEVGALPSPFAAMGVFESMKAALMVVYKSDSFENRSVAIKGLGNVGLDLAKRLLEAKAEVIGADINPKRVAYARKQLPNLRIVSNDKIASQKVDIYSPCALGGEFDSASIQMLRSKIVCGSANNQLQTTADAKRLFRKNILYVPDYLANSGGLVAVVDELHKNGFNLDRVEKNILKIKNTVYEILMEAQKKGLPTDTISNLHVKRKFSALS